MTARPAAGWLSMEILGETTVVIGNRTDPHASKPLFEPRAGWLSQPRAERTTHRGATMIPTPRTYSNNGPVSTAR